MRLDRWVPANRVLPFFPCCPFIRGGGIARAEWAYSCFVVLALPLEQTLSIETIWKTEDYRQPETAHRPVDSTSTRLTSEPISFTEFVDEKSGESTRRYEIVAVDRLGQEGEPSQPVWSRREWARFYVPYVGPWHQ